MTAATTTKAHLDAGLRTSSLVMSLCTPSRMMRSSTTANAIDAAQPTIVTPTMRSISPCAMSAAARGSTMRLGTKKMGIQRATQLRNGS